MWSRKFRRLAVVLFILGAVSLAPAPAQARERGWRDAGGITRQVRGVLSGFRGVLHRLFELSRGGMDPNGES